MSMGDVPIRTFTKDPAASLDYSIDWSAWLANGVTITASAWTVEDGLTKVTDSKTDTSTTIQVSGGTAGTTYKAKNAVTLSDGKVDARTIAWNVEER